jgi:hypothetical protein
MKLGAVLLILLPAVAAADEGMWLPEQAPEVAARFAASGLSLDPTALADPYGDPLGAIASFGFCSASFVSADGLLVTNHHCVENYLSYLSHGGTDAHTQGFQALRREDEASVGPSARLWVMEAVTDVTADVLRGITSKTPDRERRDRVELAKSKLIATCEKERDRRCSVSSQLGGSAFRLIRNREIQDLRLVYAPPLSVGQFGGEVDNWMWPRHGADFAFLRAYVGGDGSSKPFAADNVPFRPGRTLTPNWAGLQPGDFVMAAGVPGSTGRLALAAELRDARDVALPERRRILADIVAILQRHAVLDPAAAGILGGAIGSLENTRKNDDGTLDGLARFDLVAAKEREERDFLAWVDGDRQARVRPAYDELLVRVAERQARERRERWVAWMVRGADLLSAATTALRFADEATKPDLKRDAGYQDRDRLRAGQRMERLQKTLHLASDRDVLAYLLSGYAALPDEARIPALDTLLAQWGGSAKALELLYAAPALGTVEGRAALLSMDAKALRASSDPWVRLAVAIESFRGPAREAEKGETGAMLRLRAVVVRARADWAAARGVPMYDDANGTLRLTFGHVDGYSVKDGLRALEFTTLSGLVGKVGAEPFDVPADFVVRAASGPTSRWADARLRDVPVDFLTTLDTTGGNSGSAVLDGRGQWVGLVFDGNWEAIASDWVFLPEVTRSICVDLRYIAWVLDGDEAGRRVLRELGAAI